MLDQLGMAAAARALGYRGAAEVIERDQLSVEQAARMILAGAARDRGHVAAVVVLAAPHGGTIRAGQLERGGGDIVRDSTSVFATVLALRSLRKLRTGRKNGHYGSYSTAGEASSSSRLSAALLRIHIRRRHGRLRGDWRCGGIYSVESIQGLT